MSEGKAVPVRLAEPVAASSSKSTWFVVAGAAVAIGGVMALAFSGNAEHARAVSDPVGVAEMPAADVADEAPIIPDAPMTLATASQSISIEMYSATWCSACQAAHRWMDREGIAYHEIDVDRQTNAIAQLSTLNPRRTLPTFDVEGQVLVGFDQVALTSAIFASSTPGRLADGAARRHR